MKIYNKRRSTLLFIVIACTAFLAACNKTEIEDEKETKLIVAVSIVPEKTFAEEIGGKTMGLSPLAADYIDNLKNMAETMAEAMQ